jgi:excisionase family DNA binding protein
MSQPKVLSVANRLAVSPAEAARLVGIGRTKLYEAIGAGELKSLKIGSRRLVAIDALHEWLRHHEVASQRIALGSRVGIPPQANSSADAASGIQQPR